MYNLERNHATAVTISKIVYIVFSREEVFFVILLFSAEKSPDNMISENLVSRLSNKQPVWAC